jgi:hypothetical protein
MKHPIREMLEAKKSEAKIQSEIVAYMRNELKIERGLFFSIPNDGQFASKFLATGLVPGFPDLCLLNEKTAYFFEVKVPGQKPRANQVEIHETLFSKGFEVFVVTSLDQFRIIVAQILTPK